MVHYRCHVARVTEQVSTLPNHDTYGRRGHIRREGGSLDCPRRADRPRTIATVLGEGCVTTEALAAGKYQQEGGGGAGAGRNWTRDSVGDNMGGEVIYCLEQKPCWQSCLGTLPQHAITGMPNTRTLSRDRRSSAQEAL